MSQIEKLIEEARLQRVATEERDYTAYVGSLEEIEAGLHDGPAILAIAARFGKELEQLQADLAKLASRREQHAHIEKWQSVQPRLAAVDQEYAAKVAAFKLIEDRHTEELHKLRNEAEQLRSLQAAADSAGQALQLTAGERHLAKVTEVNAGQQELIQKVRELDKKIGDKSKYRIAREEQELTKTGATTAVLEKQAKAVWDAITVDLNALEAEKAGLVQEIERYNGLYTAARESLWNPLAI